MAGRRLEQVTRGVGFTMKQVTVDEIISEKQYAICRDLHGNTLQVPTNVRRAKGGFPQVGERWMINREFGPWGFAAIIGTDAVPPLITASREGADPLTIQVLDALISLGLVVEQAPEEPTED